MKTETIVGDCRNEELVEEIFGSVSECARLVEDIGDEFCIGKYLVTYNEDTDIHTFSIPVVEAGTGCPIEMFKKAFNL